MAVTNDPTARTSVATSPARLSAPLITVPDCPPDVVEAYDTLLTNVDVALGVNAGGMVAVAALDDSADAPLVAANLALVAARSGERTLLVDCDLERAGLNQLFGLDATPGLAQFLGGEHHELSTLAQSTTLPLLGVIASGARGARHNRLARHGDVPAALLRLKNAADRVVLAAPPVLTSTDVLRLGPYVDGVVLVLSAGRTQREAAARARAILDRGEVTLLGVVLQ